MELLDLFHKWVPLYVRLPVLFLIFFVTLTLNGIYLGNANEMANNLGAYPESFTQAYNAIYIGMGLGLIFHYRLKMRFTNKQLLLFGLTTLFLMHVVCATTSNTTVFIAACLLIGFGKISALVEVYIIWMFIWSKKFDASRLYPFVYFTALSGIYFMNWLTAYLAFIYNWRYAYIAVLILILLSIICAVIFVENNVLHRKLPLYQVDYWGLCLLGTSLLLLNYASVNARVADWPGSKILTGSLFASLITLLLFARRQLSLKRPLFDLRMFRSATFRRGLFYCVIMGVFLPGTFQSAFSAGILQYDAATNMAVNLYLIPGVVVGCVFCYCWYYFKFDSDLLIMTGFLSFVVYHIILYHSFSKSFSEDDFILPSIVKGFATALLYISVGLLTIKGFGLEQLVSAAGAMLIFRSFLGSGVFTAIYAYLLYTQRIRHTDYLAVSTDSNNFAARALGRTLYQTIQEQATLSAAKELTGLIIIVGLVFVGYLLLSYLYKKLSDQRAN